MLLPIPNGSRLDVFSKKAVLKKSAMESIVRNLLGCRLKLYYKLTPSQVFSFLVNFKDFFKTAFLQSTYGRVFLYSQAISTE